MALAVLRFSCEPALGQNTTSAAKFKLLGLKEKGPKVKHMAVQPLGRKELRRKVQEIRTDTRGKGDHCQAEDLVAACGQHRPLCILLLIGRVRKRNAPAPEEVPTGLLGSSQAAANVTFQVYPDDWR